MSEPQTQPAEIESVIDFDSDKPLACPLNPELGEICEACQ